MPESELTELVGAFSNELEAKLVQGALKQKGITSSVHRFSRYRAMGGGGYTLKTSPGDRVRAENIINAKSAPADMDEYVDAGDRSYRRCPACNSVNVSAEPYTRQQLVLGVCSLGMGLLFVTRHWHCAKCAHQWRGR